jgi:peptidyl-prolyl cis-trans isomerase D
MGMMTRMRSLAPWFMFLVGGIFVLFMVLSDTKLTDIFNKQRQNIGSVDGEDITYQEYSNFVDRARKSQEQNGQTIDESQMDYFRDQVWDALVTQKLVDKKVKEFGIVVTDDEIRETLLGPNPPAQLRQQFTDSTGTFNRQLYEATIKDPRNKQIMVAVEEQLRQQLVQQKLQDFVSNSVTVSEDEALDNFVKQNIKMKADYVAVDVNSISDADVKVTDADVKQYFENHPEDYQIDAQRKLKFVLFRKVASQSDTLTVQKNMQALVNKMKTDTSSFKSYVTIYSEKPYSRDTLPLSRVPEKVRDVLNNANPGDVVGPLVATEGAVIYKVIGKTNSKNAQVKASHILVKSTGDDNADLKKATGIYNELMKGINFEKMARATSDDGSKNNGGDVGWFGKGQMVKPFEDACFNGPIGVVQKPVKSQFGYHIIKVTGKSNTDFIVEQIVNKISISGTTQDKIYQDATDFAYVAKKDGYEAEAKLLKYNVVETTGFGKDARMIPGIGANAALVKWAFDESVGEISDVFKVPAGYVVAMVSDANKAGVQKFEEAKETVKRALVREKKLNKAMSLLKDVLSKNSGDPISIAKSVWPGARIDTTGEFTVGGGVQRVGREYAFTEYAYKADLNKWSNPVKGKSGAYLIKVNYRTKFDSATYALQKADIKKQLLVNKKSRFFMQWVQDLKKDADIVDNRYLFYRY